MGTHGGSTLPPRSAQSKFAAIAWLLLYGQQTPSGSAVTLVMPQIHIPLKGFWWMYQLKNPTTHWPALSDEARRELADRQQRLDDLKG